MLDILIIPYLEEYSKAGFNLVPLKEKDKIPAVRWKSLIKTPLAIEKLRAVYSKNPKLNIGIITGVSSGGLVVIDIDHSPPEELAFLIAQNPTVTVQTSRGRHYYYRSNGKLLNLNFDWGEFRANDVYILAPPSIHPDGTCYKFLDGCRLDEISDLPDSILNFLTLKGTVEVKNKKSPPMNELKYPFIGGKKNLADSEENSYSFLGGKLKNTYQDPEVAFKVVKLCGINVSKLGEAFKCPIHKEENPSAALWRGKNGNIMLHEFHQGDNFWTLPEMYVSCINHKKEFIQLSQSQMVRWWIRALSDIGYIQLPLIKFKPLPSKTPKNAKNVYDGIILLIRIQKFYDSNQAEEVLFGQEFGLIWCGYSDKNSIKDGLRWLLKNGYLENTKEAVICGKREAALYRLKKK